MCVCVQVKDVLPLSDVGETLPADNIRGPISFTRTRRVDLRVQY